MNSDDISLRLTTLRTHIERGETESAIESLDNLAEALADIAAGYDTEGDPVGWKIIGIGSDGSVLCEDSVGHRRRYLLHPQSVAEDAVLDMLGELLESHADGDIGWIERASESAARLLRERCGDEPSP